MKKRFWIPGVLVVGLGGLCVLGYYQWGQQIEMANGGDMEACKGLHKYAEDGSVDGITNSDCLKLLATPFVEEATPSSATSTTKDTTPSYVRKPGISDYQNCLNLRDEVNAVQAGLGDKSYDCESIKSFVKPADRVKAAREQNLARSCEDQLKPSLHDPRSYRYVDKKFIATGDNGLDLTITYSATNKLGGRIQSTHTCSYTF